MKDGSMEQDKLVEGLKSLGIKIEIIPKNGVEVSEDAVLHSSFHHLGKDYTVSLSLPENMIDSMVECSSKYKDLKLDMDAILEVIPEYIFICDKEGKALRVSASWKNLWWHGGKDFFEKSVFEVERDQVISPSASRLALERNEQVQIVQETNSGRTLMVIGTPIRDENGEVIKVISVSKDITELDLLKKQLDKERGKNKRLSLQNPGKDEVPLIYNSDAMSNVLVTAFKISKFDSTVLLLGESGVGKEVVANHIQKWSKRSSQPFVKVNCGSIPENLLESELFGYEAGSFTGASKEGKAGLFEMADKGTIFLDEIGDMPYNLQVRLLRVLQEREVTRVGGVMPKKVDVRVIAATNKDLEREVKENRFREDLYYRLNVVPIAIPPLRERKEDLLPLIVHFTELFNRNFSDKKIFSPESIDILQRYDWPGNIRELQNMIERIILTADYDYIEPSNLPAIFHTLKEDPDESHVLKNEQAVQEYKEDTSRADSLVIQNYRKVGMTHGEMGLYCNIIVSQQENNASPTVEDLAETLQCSTRQIRKWLQSLKEKGFLIIEQSFNPDTGTAKNHYNFQPLLEILSKI
ncbi:PAS domain-containing protein [Siminovitchia acidinfaciens]|uniref:PAS domain-containing protein n=1 Tax=Siminovitchia acidinfaciens TaxID=2321395 RepID=A0A429XV59_9BACI|nr:sigma 54-interacting transcriptional regulator [Siminovitchia acidinfaciens]RST72064.1 PAS domain-containing protein [Siminovitchia acidinfaciens]